MIGYQQAHLRANAVLPAVCEHADKTCNGRLEAAFRHDVPERFVERSKTGLRYSPDPEHYMKLCRSHHIRFDMTPQWRAHIAAGMRGRTVSAETRAKQSAARKRYWAAAAVKAPLQRGAA